jgi:hypothetical protein
MITFVSADVLLVLITACVCDFYYSIRVLISMKPNTLILIKNWLYNVAFERILVQMIFSNKIYANLY